MSCLFQLSSLLPETLGTGKFLSQCCKTRQAGPRSHREGLWYLMQCYQTLCFAASIPSSPLRIGFTPMSCSHMAWRCSRSTRTKMDAQTHAAWQAQLVLLLREDHVGPRLAPDSGFVFPRWMDSAPSQLPLHADPSGGGSGWPSQ